MARSKDFYAKYYYENIRLTKKGVRESVGNDNLIVQCISSIGDIDRATNILAKGLREWYELQNPEFSRKIDDHQRFVEMIIAGKDIKKPDSMGADLGRNDRTAILNMARKIESLYALRRTQEGYLQRLMNKTCPNVNAIAGSLVGAKLLAHAGSLKRLSIFTASTIQLLGAEKALFRHIRTGSKAPKHGLILQHPLLQSAKAKDRGKVARALSDKISIAAKVDYFKGKFIGDKLKKALEKRFKHKIL